jgi:hypothetical protein
MHGKTMKEALNEVRSFRDATSEGGPGSGPQKGGKKQSSADIKKAYGILNDPRYKQGNFSGAARAIDKLSPGLSDHPDVKNAMKRANEELEEERTYTVIHTKHGIEKSIKANGTYDAAQKYAKMKGLKDTSGVNAHLNEELEEENRFSRQLKGRQREVYDLALKDIRKNKVYGEKDQDAVVDKVAGTSLMGNSLADVKQAIQHESLDLSATGDTTTSNASQENETVEEARFSQSQIDALKKEFEPMRDRGEKNGLQMDKLAKTMKNYPKPMLDTLAKSDIPMVSKVAKELLK